jgi:hypothetical protein
MTNTDPSLGGAAAKGEQPTLPGAYFAVAYFTGNDDYKPSQSPLSEPASFTVYGTMDVNALIVPNIGNLVYNGTQQAPVVWENSLYVITENNGGETVGDNYQVILTVANTDEYRWADPKGGANYTLNSDVQGRIDEAVKGVKPDPIDPKTTPEYMELSHERDMLRAIGGEEFQSVKPKFREQIYGMMDHSAEAKPAAEQLAGLRENWEEMFFPEKPADQPKNTPQFAQQPGRTGVNPTSEEDKLFKQLSESWK